MRAQEDWDMEQALKASKGLAAMEHPAVRAARQHDRTANRSFEEDFSSPNMYPGARSSVDTIQKQEEYEL